MEIKIYADAGSNLFDSLLKEKNAQVTIIPMTLDIEGKIYKCYEDNIDVESFSKGFYEELRAGKNVKTSLANPNIFLDAFKKDVDEGNKIICFTLASGISGTYQSACIAANQINDEKGEEVVHIIDAKTASLGEGAQALYAYELVQKGLLFDEIIKACEERVSKVRSEFTVDDIRYLKKTGRVSAVVAKIASLLNIKVLLKGNDEAKIVSFGKVHGRMMSIKTLAKTCLDHIVDINQTIYITHCDAEEDAQKLKDLLVAGGCKNVELYYYDLITGSHVGPGTLAVFYVGENRNN